MLNIDWAPESVFSSRKTGQEVFQNESDNLQIRLLDFWQWSASDLLNNTTRGRLAEFIVASDLGVHVNTRIEWDAFDLTAQNGSKIEVKSAAYIQGWQQQKPSLICFDIRPTIAWSSETRRYEGQAKRQSDIYIFCLLEHQDKASINPLRLEQWIFYLVPTKFLDENLPLQKTVSLRRLLKLKPAICKYGQIKETLLSLMEAW